MTDTIDNSQDGRDNAGRDSDNRSSDIRTRAQGAFDDARDSVAGAGRRATEGIDEAPLIALAAGIAAGAVLAALLPRSKSEERVLRPVGDKLSGTAKAAANAAKDAGKSRLAELGITPEKGRDTLRSLFEGAGEAAKTSAQAAFSAGRSRE